LEETGKKVLFEGGGVELEGGEGGGKAEQEMEGVYGVLSSQISTGVLPSQISTDINSNQATGIYITLIVRVRVCVLCVCVCVRVCTCSRALDHQHCALHAPAYHSRTARQTRRRAPNAARYCHDSTPPPPLPTPPSLPPATQCETGIECNR